MSTDLGRVRRWRPGQLGAVIVAALAIAAIDAALAAAGDRVSRGTQALVLLVPVLGAAVVAGRRAALAVGIVAMVGFSLVLPPVGSPKVRLADDLVALAVFALVVIVIVVTFVAGRIEVLNNVERQRRLLLRSVSHDLRTPLAAIGAAASELAEGNHVDDNGRAMVELISRQVGQLDRLVANLLSLNRIEAGALKLNLQPVDASELVRHVIDQRTEATDTPIDLRLAEDLPTVRGDFTLLGQVVVNLVENAIRHSPPGHAVEIATAHRDAYVEIAVSDHGPGVPVDQRMAIFEPFRSGGNAGTSGIGLAISRAIVGAHAGTITAGAGADGGAIFTVRLPV